MILIIKRTVLSLLIAFISLSNSFAQSLNSYFTSDNIGYTITSTEKRTVSISFYTSDCSTNIIIPDKVIYNGIEYNVTSIDDYAFDGCSGLTSINLPSSVTSIGNYAFSDCSHLTSINIPASVTTIGNNAFSDCSGLTSINIPSSVTSIGNYAFSYCSHLTSINIPASVTNIANYAFLGCSGLTSISIPHGVTSIGKNAFSGCSGLKSINIPSSVTNIINYPFHGCSNVDSIFWDSNASLSNIIQDCKSNLKFVEIGNNVTSIGDDAFSGCSGLTSITVASDNKKYDSRENSNAIILTATNTLIKGCKKTIIPSSVTSIGDDAFSGCSGLTSINIPSSVTSIGYAAFFNCSGLTSIDIPSSVTSIGSEAFSYCSGLTSINIPSSITSIGNEYRCCSGLTSINIPSSVTSIGIEAFYGCNGLTSINIPSSVTNIGKKAFYGCRGLTSINIPSSVTSIGYEAFYGCSGLNSINIPSSVTSIEYGAFEYCSGLTSIEIPSSVTSIADFAFYGCSGLTSINIPSSVTSIGYAAFSGCRGLTSINIPSSVTSIGDAAFSGCSGLTSITVASDNEKYDSRENSNAIIQTTTNTLITGCKKTIIPSSVTSIGNYAFSDCNGLTSINIPSSVTSIGAYAFSGNTGLKTITLNSLPLSTNNLGYYDAILFVPSDLVEECRNHPEWGKFKIIKPIGASIEKEITFSDEGYSTFYDSQYSYELPPELIALAINGISDGILLYDTIADGSKGEILPAGTAALIKNNKPESVPKLILSASSNLYQGLNLLMGSDYETTTYSISGKISLFYKLSYGPSESDLNKVLGWYWGARDGDEFPIEAHKAWLAIPIMPQTKGSVGFSLSGEPTIDKEVLTYFIDSDENLYELNGRRLLTPLKDKVFIINGKKKIIIR